VAFSPDGRHALSGSADKTLILWDLATGQRLRTFTGHTGDVRSVAFSRDGSFALSGSADHSVILWDVGSGAEIGRFTGHTDRVTSVAFSPDGKSALSGSTDMTIRMWRIDTLADLISWTQNNRYYPALTCEQREQYQLLPPCHRQGTLPIPEATPTPGFVQ